MGAAAPYIVPAIIGGASTMTRGLIARGGAGSAADRQAAASLDAARITGQGVQDQLRAAQQAARQLRADTELTRGANYGQWRADLLNTTNLTQDQANQARIMGNILGENTYNQFWDTEENRRQERQALGRTAYGQDVARNLHLARIQGQTGGGPRYMGQLFEPGALVRSPYERVPEYQWRDPIIPEYVSLPPAMTPTTDEPPAAPATGAEMADRAQGDEERRRRRGRPWRDEHDFERDA